MDLMDSFWTFILTAPIHCRGSIGEKVIGWTVLLNYPVGQIELYHMPYSGTQAVSWISKTLMHLLACSFIE